MQSARSSLALKPDQVNQFREDGYYLSPSMFNSNEMRSINEIVATDPAIAKATFGRMDKSGAVTELALWYQLGNDVFSAIGRSSRIVDSLELLLDGEICFFHSKLSLKKPNVGGSWEWHQDYGYWYRDGYLFPHMASVFIALDPSTKENGCLQVVKGSHHLGRIEHGVVAGQIGADQTRVDAVRERLPTVECEMQPGDVLFFHGNLLHASGPNVSLHSRNVLISCYSRADNAPHVGAEKQHHSHIDKLPDEELARYFTQEALTRGSVIDGEFYKDTNRN